MNLLVGDFLNMKKKIIEKKAYLEHKTWKQKSIENWLQTQKNNQKRKYVNHSLLLHYMRNDNK